MKKSINNLVNHFSLSGFSSIINFLAILYFSIYYTPEELAFWGAYLVITPIILVLNLSVFSELSLIEKKKSDVFIFVYNLFFISFILSILFILIFYFIIDFTPYNKFYKINSEKLSFILILIIYIFFSTFKNLQSSFLIRFSKFKTIGKLNFLRAIFFLFFGIFFSYKDFFFNKIISAFIFSELLVFLYSVSKNDIKGFKFLNFSPKKIIIFLRYLKSFSIWSIGSYLFNTLTYLLIYNYILQNFSKTEAGIYTALNRIILAPIQLINKIVGDIFVSQISKSIRVSFSPINTFNNFSKLLIFLSFIIFMVGFFIFPHLYNKLNFLSFVETYYPYYKPFIIYGSFMLISSTLSRYLIVSKNFKTDFIWQIIVFSSIFILCQQSNLSFETFLFYFSILFSILYCIYYAMIRNRVKKISKLV